MWRVPPYNQTGFLNGSSEAEIAEVMERYQLDCYARNLQSTFQYAQDMREFERLLAIARRYAIPPSPSSQMVQGNGPQVRGDTWGVQPGHVPWVVAPSQEGWGGPNVTAWAEGI
jgi:hypothetical protein